MVHSLANCVCAQHPDEICADCLHAQGYRMRGQCSYPGCMFVSFSGFDECGQHVAPTPRACKVGLFENGQRRSMIWEERLSHNNGATRSPGCPCEKLCEECVLASEWHPAGQCIFEGCPDPRVSRRVVCAAHLVWHQAELDVEYTETYDEPLPDEPRLNPIAVAPEVLYSDIAVVP